MLMNLYLLSNSRNGEEWWRVRSEVEEIMMKPKNIVYYLPEVDNIALEFVQR